MRPETSPANKAAPVVETFCVCTSHTLTTLSRPDDTTLVVA